MNILYIIGNGFDLNLGLQTSYEDFLNYYREIPSKNDTIQNLKRNIKGKKKDWSDLELAFGDYTTNFKSLEDFDLAFDDLKDELAAFLTEQEIQLDFDKIDQKVFFEYIKLPEKYLLPADKSKINSFLSKWTNPTCIIDITTFNYTTILDRLLKSDKKPLSFGIRPRGQTTQLNRLIHIHGYLEKHMIFGINDIEQIGNIEFRSNQDIINAIVKDKSNESNKLTNEFRFREQIKKANLIVIFGCSIGETDKLWWELIGKRLTQDCILILFKKGEELKPRQEHKLPRYEKAIKTHFLDKTLLNESERQIVEEKIFIGLNTSFFGF